MAFSKRERYIFKKCLERDASSDPNLPFKGGYKIYGVEIPREKRGKKCMDPLKEAVLSIQSP
jgi:hypothetical protein